MKTEQMICKKCHGQMELSADGRSMICRSCGASELVQVSDAVKETRIKADAAKEIVLEKKRIDSDTQIKEQNLELEKEKFRFIYPNLQSP